MTGNNSYIRDLYKVPMLGSRIFGVLEDYDDEWVVLSREGVVVDHGPKLCVLRLKHRRRGAAVTLLRVPPSARLRQTG